MSEQHRDPALEHEWVQMHLPFFVNATLSPEEHARCQAHLAACEQCVQAVRDEQQLRDAMRIEEPMVYAPQASLAKLNNRIDADIRRANRRAASTAWVRRVLVKPWAALPSVYQWALAVQAAVILGLCLLLGAQVLEAPASPGDYQTLSSPSSLQGSDIRIKVVFAPSATLGEVTTLLNRWGAHIVSGPSRAGMVELEFFTPPRTGEELDALATRLQATELVEFVSVKQTEVRN